MNRGQPKRYQVMLCCNDERGDFTGRVTALDIADEIRIASVDTRGSAIRFSDSRMKIIRRAFARTGRQSCVGNVFWDATSMVTFQARQLVSYLLANGWVVEEHAEEGPFADLVPKFAPIADLIARSSIGAGLRNIEENGLEAELADLEDEMRGRR